MIRRKRKVKQAAGNPFRKPVWEEFDVDLIDVDKVAVRREVSQGSRYYNYTHKSKDGKKWFLEYLKKEKIDKDKIKHVKLVPDWQVGITYGALAKMLMDGCPPLEEYTMALDKRLERCLQVKVKKPKEEAEVKSLAPVLSIQERMKLNLNDFLGQNVENEIDNFFDNGLKSDFKMTTALQLKEITGKAAALIPAMYAQDVADFNTLLNPVEKDDEYEQLVEAYPYKKAEIKRILEFYNMIIDDAIHHSNIQKANRKVRAKKTPTKEKQIAKLKYKANDDRYKLVSIDPKTIIGAQELWVFNTKTRKIGKYISTNGFTSGNLGIKGTSITGFDTNTSMQKTLRKPEESLKEFASAGKVVLRKFLDNLTTTGIKLNGRVNSDVILLKVF